MTSLWQGCIDFLRSAELLEENIQIETVDQLAVLLLDGVRLCKLANFLFPGSIEEHRIERRRSLTQRSHVS